MIPQNCPKDCGSCGNSEYKGFHLIFCEPQGKLVKTDGQGYREVIDHNKECVKHELRKQ